MAPLIKTSLTLLSLSLSLVSAASPHQPAAGHHGKHLKLAKRTLFEGLGKREEFAPYGYDRCGVPRTSPYVRKAGASPSASAKWTPCPTGQSEQQKAQANPAVPTASDEEESANGGVFGVAPQTQAASPSSSSASADNSNNNGGNGGVFGSGAGPTDNGNAALASPSSSSKEEWHSTDYTTSFVDVTSTQVWTPEPSSSPAPAPQQPEDTWTTPAAKVAIKAPQNKGNGNGNGNNGNGNGNNGNGNGNNDASSSSSDVAPPAYTPPAVVPSGNNKLGVAWDWRNPKGVLNQWTGASYVYTWSAYPPSDGLPDGMQFLPQYWGPGKEGDIQGQIARGVIKPGMTILGYNEPDQPGQANLGVWDAIGAFKRQLTPLASQGYKITSPACTSDEKGFQWISEFMNNCKDCGISILQTHYYGTNADDFIAYIQRLRVFGLPIIISEYASETFGYGADLSLEETKAFVSKTQNWLNQQGDIIAYFYFGPLTSWAAGGVNPNSLMISDDGNMNGLGAQYLSSA